jgi:hypothetical protein
MNLLIVTGKQPKAINLDNILYVKSRTEYTPQEATKLTTIYFVGGKPLDVEASMDEVLEAIKGNMTLKEGI